LFSRRPFWRSRIFPPISFGTEAAVQPSPVGFSGGIKNYFYCFLGSQPSYLAPARLLPQEFDPTEGERLVVNPNAWFSWRNEMPDAVAACHPLPDKFLRGVELIWICDPATSTQTVFWADPTFLNEISDLSSGETVPPDFSPRLAAVLSTAGLLVRPDDAFRRAADWNETSSQSSRLFQQRGYVPLSRLIHPFQLGSLRRYYRHLLRTGGMKLGDSGDPRRFVAHNESVASFLHRQLANIVSEVARVPVKPSYVYVVSYQSGAELAAHTDRAQCEYSITVLIDYTPEPVDRSPWPLHLKTGNGSAVISQGLGDGLLYRGRLLPHHRTKLAAGMTSTSILFHYVDQDFDGSLD
jgi:hypothetical protein